MARKAEHLCEENRVLKEAIRTAIGKTRIPLTDEQRRRLATKGKALSPTEREECCIEPVPERNRMRTWKQFLRSHWETLRACDFFSVETLGVFGTVRHMVFFVIELKSRAVRIAGVRVEPDGAWMQQVARNLFDPLTDSCATPLT
jgi:hypothetical protein